MTTVRQLVNSLGTSDNIIAGNPKMTYMRDVYKRTTQCTNQLITMQFPKNIYYGSEVTVDLYQEADIIDAAWLQLAFPTSGSTVCDSFGTYVLNWVQLECGNQIIERLHGEYIELFNDLTVPQGKQGALSNLVGKNLTSNLASYSVKLPFSAFKYGLPVCALKENVRIRFNIRNFYECVSGTSNINPLFNATMLVNYIFLQEEERNFFVKNPLTYLVGQNQYFSTQFVPNMTQYSFRPFQLPLLTLGTAPLFTFNMPKFTNQIVSVNFQYNFTTTTTPANISGLTLTVNGATVSATSSSIVGTRTTVNYTATSGIYSSKNLVTYTWTGVTVTAATVQVSGTYTGGGSNPYTIFTEFRNPCKELFFVLQPTSAAPYDYTLDGTNDVLSSLRIRLDDKEYLKSETGTPFLLRIIKGLDRHVRIPDRRFYMYSFSIDPENNQPSGTLNLGMVTRQQFDFSINMSGAPVNLRMYARTYNLMQIQDGKLAMLYPGPTDINGLRLNTFPQTAVAATGGTITNIAPYRIHTFTASGNFVVTTGGIADILVVGGGGGSGGSVGDNNANGNGSYGGGGGGVVYVGSYNLIPQTYNITVGAGGVGGLASSINTFGSVWGQVPTQGSNGGNSSFGTLTAYGGGGGGCNYYGSGIAPPGLPFSGFPGLTGGSGGSGYLGGGSGITGQGFAGVNSSTSNGSVGGGGGGAGGTSTASSTTAGNGVSNSISGTPTYYGGGGGNAVDAFIFSNYPVTGGLGGGGTGSVYNVNNGIYFAGSAGTANTGGGGGGSSVVSNYVSYAGMPGYAGGSGIVIIRYRNS